MSDQMKREYYQSVDDRKKLVSLVVNLFLEVVCMCDVVLYACYLCVLMYHVWSSVFLEPFTCTLENRFMNGRVELIEVLTCVASW